MPIKKRFIAAINVKNNLAVQSINYREYLPLGEVGNFVECYDRWNVDEIFIQEIDRSAKNLGPNISLIKRISNLPIKTPIIYGGGIKSVTDAINVINSGADRVVVGSLFFENYISIKQISSAVGSQAVIISLPVITHGHNMFFFNYLKKKLIKYEDVVKKLEIIKDFFSEIIITDVNNEGVVNNYNLKILTKLQKLKYPIISYGGIGHNQIKKIINNKKISAFAIGNFLAFKELNYQKILSKLKINLLRLSFYSKEIN